MAQNFYGHGVRMGNWNEDVYLEEELMKDFLEKRDKGQLLIQRSIRLKENLLRPTQLSISEDGHVHHGDSVMLVNPDYPDTEADLFLRGDLSLCLAPDEIRAHLSDAPEVPCGLSAAPTSIPLEDVLDWSRADWRRKLSERSGFITLGITVRGPSPTLSSKDQEVEICVQFNVLTFKGIASRELISAEPAATGDILRFGQNFRLGIVRGFDDTMLYLSSDHRTLLKSSKRSWLQEVYLTDEVSYLNCWQAAFPDPQLRLEHEGVPIPANRKILINHCHTNRGLAAHRHLCLRTYFGKEAEVAAHTHLDSHRAEKPRNHWVLVTGSPRKDSCTVLGERAPPPQDAHTPEQAAAQGPSDTPGVASPDTGSLGPTSSSF